jgi:hypothetical protein
MSTKTTFKRIALVTVAALGFGVLTAVAPASAAPSTGLSAHTGSITIVGANNGVAGTGGVAIYRLSVTDAAGAAVLASTESITATVTGVPAALADGVTVPKSTDLRFNEVNTTIVGVKDTATAGLLTTDAAITSANQPCVWPNSQDTEQVGTYCMAVEGKSGLALDYGTYTITFSLNDANGNVRASTTVKYTAVSTSAKSGAVITVAAAGNPQAGQAWTSSATSYMRATLRDANGGYIYLQDTTSANTRQPLLSATLEAATTEAVLNTLYAQDTYSSTAWATDYGTATGSTPNDGVYILKPALGAVISSSISTTAASVIRVLYGSSSGTGSISGLPTAASVSTASTFGVSGAGLVMSSPTTDTTTANSARTYQVPLTTTSITLSWILRNAAGTALVNEPVTVSTVWTGANAGAITPVSGATGAVIKRSDNTGLVTYTVTQTAPLTGSQAVVSVTGQVASGVAFGDTTLLWRVPTLTTISTSPGANFKAVAASSVSVVATARDQFGAPMAGVVLQPGISGTTSPNYTATAKATLTTGADGTATYTFTGGAASTTITDTVTFTGAAGTVAATSRVVTYVAALPVAATLTGSYTLDQSSSTYANLFSTTAITNAGTSLSIDRTLDTSATISTAGTSASDAQLKFNVQALDSAGAAVTGIPVVATATAGCWFVSSSTNKAVTTVTLYPSATGEVTAQAVITLAGTCTYTFTAGATVLTQTVKTKNATADARNVSLTASGSDVTAKVTDRFGNAVAGINVQLSTSVGTLGNGQKTSVYTTNTSGEIAIVVDVDGATTVTAYLSDANDSTSLAGYSGTSIIDASVPAGIRTATVAATGTGSLSSTAQAAVDAAAEATDAANAATDAANAAAEAADAATAAAQDAADAVAALSTQVSEMVDALKKQITALTNLVIKIQKKVRA